MRSRDVANPEAPDRPSDHSRALGIWFPTVRAGTGADFFTERLVKALRERGIRAEITWLPLRAEYAPWSVALPRPPEWATVVHINSWLHRRFIPKDLPLVVTLHHCVHDPAFKPYKNLPRTLYHRFWIKRCEAYSIWRANRVTAVSQYSADQFHSAFNPSDIRVLYNWIDTSIFSPDSRTRPHQPFRLLFVGKPSVRKGVDLLPRIMKVLGPDFELRYTGAPRDIGLSDLPQNMVGTGRLPDQAALVEAYRNADALLFPSRLEGFGFVALEAQACARPVIATHGSSLPEIIKDGSTGILCAPDDIRAFAAAARHLREDPDRWKATCDAARERATTLFSEKTSLDGFINLYKQARSSR